MPVVLVTGSARRLGKEIALGLAKQGWDVAIHHHMAKWPAEEVVDEIKALGVNAKSFGADLSNEEECRALLPKVIEAMGSVQAIINSAAVFEDDDASTFSYDRFIRHMKINTAPAIILAQALQEHIKTQEVAHTEDAEQSTKVVAKNVITIKQEGEHDHPHIAPRPEAPKEQPLPPQGVVVNMLDQKLWNLNPDHLSYTLSKASLKVATETLARELAPFVRVVGVAPGVTMPKPTMIDARQMAALQKEAPLGHFSRVEDIVQTVCFAVNNRALTGTHLVVDGGQHLMHLPRDISKNFSHE